MSNWHPAGAQQSTFLDPQDEPAPPGVTVYTDGGCDPNPGPGGWAAVIVYPDREVVLAGNDPQSTNNRMEMEAALAALAHLQGRHGACSVDLHTDSTYLRKGISEWIERWVANGWQTQTKQAVKNQALWRRLYDLTRTHQVRWHWVKGHAGNPLNERVDRLATEARDRLPAVETHLAPSPPPPPVAAAQDVADLPGDAPTQISVAVTCPGGKGPGRWAAVLRAGQAHALLSGDERETTGNLLLLQAATAALQALPPPAEVTVYTTSDYLGRGAAEWAAGWQQRGWMTSTNKPVKNRAQWQALLQATRPHQVTWQIVRGADIPPDLAEAKRIASP